MKNIHVLPTEKPSRVYHTNTDKLGFSSYYLNDNRQTMKNQNIYITFDEEIKDGDYALQFHYGKISIVKCDYQNKSVINNKSLDLYATKIILTTDQDLIKDGVQAIDDEFLEWFVKNPSCEKVLINKLYEYPTKIHIGYKIIIPKEIGFKMENGKRTETFYSKEEPTIEEEYTSQDFLNEVCWNNSKQETLEEAATNYTIDFATMSAFKLGAKWQQEQEKNKYSEAIDIFEYILEYDDGVGIALGYNSRVMIERFIKQFKNK
jgi:hypothetical protein